MCAYKKICFTADRLCRLPPAGSQGNTQEGEDAGDRNPE